MVAYIRYSMQKVDTAPVPEGLIPKISAYLNTQTDGRILALFRIIFGLFMSYEMFRYLQIDLVKNAFILPKVQLQYLDFIKVMPEPIMNMLIVVLLICALLITFGVLFRPACIVLGTGYLYILLIDKSIYNNHIYLFVLLAFLLACTHADHFYSFRRAKKDKPLWPTLPRWEIFIIQLQFAIVYFYGGLAKINPEWLGRMEPIKTLVDNFPQDHALAFFYAHDFQIPLLTYGGLLFDLFIPFLLWYKRTRIIALIPLMLFHVSNAFVFDDIGIFPFVMIFSTLIFFEPSELPFLKKPAVVAGRKLKEQALVMTQSKYAIYFLIAFFIFQFLFPFRGFFLPNNPDWSSIAGKFSWRMKIQTRDIQRMAFTIQDGPDNPAMDVSLNTFANPMQIMSIAADPRATVSMAKALAEEGRKQRMQNPIVKAEVLISWNGREPVYFVDPQVDLTKVTYSAFSTNPWVMPKPE